MKWLILSHGFNMDGRAASLTVTDKIPHLMAAAVEPIVISAITGQRDTRFPHYQVLPWGPAGLKFDLRHYMKLSRLPKWVQLVLLGLLTLVLLPFQLVERLAWGLSSQASWALPAAAWGLWLTRNGEVQTVYSSGGAWSAHYAAWLIKKYRGKGITWIAEIHDPMVSREVGRISREQRFIIKLENRICRDADRVFWFADEALRYAKLRNPCLGQKGFTVLPGSEPPGCYDPRPLTHTYDRDTLQLFYFGAVSFNSLGPLIEGLKRLHIRVRLIFYGTDLDEKSKTALKGLDFQTLSRLNRAESFQMMRQADILLLLHGDGKRCAECIPSKIYDYYWTDRPILALTKLTPKFDATLAERGAYVGNIDEPSTIDTALQNLIQDWQSGKLRQTLFKPFSPKGAVLSMLTSIHT